MLGAGPLMVTETLVVGLQYSVGADKAVTQIFLNKLCSDPVTLFELISAS